MSALRDESLAGGKQKEGAREEEQEQIEDKEEEERDLAALPQGLQEDEKRDEEAPKRGVVPLLL